MIAEGRPSFAFSYSYAEVCYCCGVVTARTLARDDQVAASLRQLFLAAAPTLCCVELAMVAIYIFPCEFAKCSSIGKRWSRGVERRAMLIVVAVAYAFTGGWALACVRGAKYTYTGVAAGIADYPPLAVPTVLWRVM